ncbi:MAG: RagB/SusD family nutrient uptake outer membrane protein [Flavobacteriales bacterium]|nr:MAG: RagB/SusD family nutrient uptake outer membrane protein [Flavobacteriales bacterium]
MNFSKHIKTSCLAASLATLLLAGACKKALDKEPLSNITPDKYLHEEGQLATYAVGRYTDILPSHGNWSFGTFGTDANTDNMVVPNLDNKFIPGLWRVDATGGEWNFNNIYQTNYFLTTVVPRWKAGQIIGVEENIKQYIGEMYFLRAFEYFKKLQSVGDYPIIKTVYPEDKQLLTELSKRAPRNEVARFILSDLDSAILLLKDNPDGGAKNRISKVAAQLVKSRVALYEGTWLKYFKNTAFVPNGPNWPGKVKDYNANYQYPTGGIDAEVQYFLGEAMSSAKSVADAIPLVNNTGIIEAPNNENPYLNMFGAVNMSSYSEVLLWRQYAAGVVTHNVPVTAQSGNYAVGLTKGMVESFLMENGLPIYATGSNYQGDDYIADVRKNRDGRLTLFLKEPGQKNILINPNLGTHGTPIEPTPRIWESNSEQKYTTGYAIRKGISYDGAQTNNGQGFTGSITFRASEAYLNYIEASYERNGVIDGDATRYWQALRTRAKVNTDFNQTIAATVMARETQDWGAYSANTLVSPTLYNIRRERRSELMAEGLRFMDLKRWRAMDQMIATPYHFEGFKLWGPMRTWFTADQTLYGAGNDKSVVSDPALSIYLRPQEIRSNADSYKGARWMMAHYLSPIATQHFNITSVGGDISTSPIYQNPGWSTVGGSTPTGL